MGKIIILFSLVFILFMDSCSTEPENEYIDFKIKIDKISLPDTISVNDTLAIKFDGIVGTDGCHSFKKFEVINKSNEIHITVWGQKPNYETGCPDVMVYLNGKEYKIRLSKTGNYKIIVLQPDNSVLKDSIYVD